MAEAVEQLIFGDQKINVKFKEVLTGKIRTDIFQILQDSPMAEQAKIQQEVIKELSTEGAEDLTQYQLGVRLLKKGFDTKYLFSEDNIDPELNEKYLITVYKLAQCIIDVEKTIKDKSEDLKEKIQDTLNKDITEARDFWDGQDLGFLEKKIEFFRSKIKRTI